MLGCITSFNSVKNQKYTKRALLCTKQLKKLFYIGYSLGHTQGEFLGGIWDSDITPEFDTLALHFSISRWEGFDQVLGYLFHCCAY